MDKNSLFSKLTIQKNTSQLEKENKNLKHDNKWLKRTIFLLLYIIMVLCIIFYLISSNKGPNIFTIPSFLIITFTVLLLSDIIVIFVFRNLNYKEDSTANLSELISFLLPSFILLILALLYYLEFRQN